jgi:hypothetical protein
MNRTGNCGLRFQVKVALRATKSIARHGRASPELKAARALLRTVMQRYEAGESPNADASTALVAHGKALRALGLPGLPAQPPVRS